MEIITKENSKTYGKVFNNGSEFMAVINQKSTVKGDSDIYLDGRFFKTKAGAIRWVNNQLA